MAEVVEDNGVEVEGGEDVGYGEDFHLVLLEG